jgi:hypothetical protein
MDACSAAIHRHTQGWPVSVSVKCDRYELDEYEYLCFLVLPFDIIMKSCLLFLIPDSM